MRNKIIDFSPNGLQKVFFSFYPEDKERMEKIADDILDISNCAAWYHEDSMTADDINLDDLGMKLQEMKLFVVIVSTNYLANDSLAKTGNTDLLWNIIYLSFQSPWNPVWKNILLLR